MSTKSEDGNDKKNVVVIGGGHAGGVLARTLSGMLDATKYHVVLINDRPYAIHLLAAARMTVTDDGAGCTGAEGNGLRGMRERVGGAGGTLDVTPGTPGTRVRVTLP